MDKNRQIEEMAKDLCVECPFPKCIPSKVCDSWIYAEIAVRKGYAKESEVALKLIRKVEKIAKKHYAVSVLAELAELKNKYTEGEDDGN